MTLNSEPDCAYIEISCDCYSECEEQEIAHRRNQFMQTAAKILGEQLSSEQNGNEEPR